MGIEVLEIYKMEGKWCESCGADKYLYRFRIGRVQFFLCEDCAVALHSKFTDEAGLYW